MFLTVLTALAALSFFSPSAAEKTARTFAVNHLQGKGLVTARMDPIISPGSDSAHTHVVFGGNGFGISMQDDAALKSTCTNSLIAKDGSNYWFPQLYFHSQNGSFTSVPVFYMNVYYFFEPTDDDIKAFPVGLRMISGDPFARSPPAAGGASILDAGADKPIQPIQFTCPTKNANEQRWPINSNGLGGLGIQDPQNKGAGAGFPNVECDGSGSPLRMDIHFPSCYNPNAALADYKSNTVFPSSKGASKPGYQNCPKGWIHMPHIFYEVYWDTPQFQSDWTQGGSTQPFVLAPGDPTGYAAHGDFFSGWDTDALQKIIDTCDAGDSGMDKCPQIPGGLVSADAAKQCSVKPHNPEQVTGVLDKLPGCNPIQAGPERAAMNPPGCPASDAPGSASSAAPTSSASSTGPSTVPSGSPTSSSVNPPASSSTGSGQPPAQAPSGTGALAAPTAYQSPAPWDPNASSNPTTPDAPITTGANTGNDTEACNPAPDGWSYVGCFTDSKSARILTGATTNELISMTISKCTDFCTSKGYTVAGLEWKSECYCGHDVPTQTSDQCTDKCVGDQSTSCGGWNAANVYSKTIAKRHAGHMSAHARRHVRGH